MSPRTRRGASVDRPCAEPVAASELFSRISVGRVSDVIVEQIRLVIRQGQLKPGDRLPAERELCERLGVSRVTVRQALRVLESNGLIDIRVGARGGAFVTTPSSARIGEGLTDLLLLSALTPAQVTEVRFILELGIVSAVCERATEQDIAELRGICRSARDALGRSEYTMALSAEFHIRVAESAHNPAVVMLVESFRGALLMSLRAAHDRAPEMGPLGVDEHESFVEAVAARDSARARAIMSAHLDRTARRIAP